MAARVNRSKPNDSNSINAVRAEAWVSSSVAIYRGHHHRGNNNNNNNDNNISLSPRRRRKGSKVAGNAAGGRHPMTRAKKRNQWLNKKKKKKERNKFNPRKTSCNGSSCHGYQQQPRWMNIHQLAAMESIQINSSWMLHESSRSNRIVTNLLLEEEEEEEEEEGGGGREGGNLQSGGKFRSVTRSRLIRRWVMGWFLELDTPPHPSTHPVTQYTMNKRSNNKKSIGDCSIYSNGGGHSSCNDG